MNKKIDFIELLKIIQKNWLVILCTGVLGFALSYYTTAYLITPQYQAKTQLLVNRPNAENENMDLNDIQSNIQIINTYRDILTDSVVIDQVLNELDEPLTEQALIEKMSIVIQEDSQIFRIEVVDESPERAAMIADLIASTFQENVGNILHVENVAILSAAKINSTPISPRTNFNLLIGTLIGLVAGISISLIKVMLDTKIHDEKIITEKLGWIQLGSISEMPKAFALQSEEKKVVDKAQIEENERAEKEPSHVQ
ncbi:capsular biosynthesis protein [Desemzia sp. RIT804]|uniref:YveK family protein n=1 Tax=Desemzia sp. RIT 804 TaxID=2810209 RepID=UPI00194F2AC7|nr:Wzz/FepE/Etk N-terminal domain-containing protein [Desemzia sp. RIT 804]MBM6614815.1 capsular biosynthesis protein [Desemzia sp. RIT 804]